MKAKIFRMSPAEGRVLEPVVRDEHAHIMHIALPAGEDVPAHETNANAYLAVLRGTLSIELDGEAGRYPAGTVLNIPEGAAMRMRNADAETLELLVVKTPAPGARG